MTRRRGAVTALVVGTAGRLAAAVVALVAPWWSIALVVPAHPAPLGPVGAIGAGLIVGYEGRLMTGRGGGAGGGVGGAGVGAWFGAAPGPACVAVAVLAARALFEEVVWRGPVLAVAAAPPGVRASVVVVTSIGFALAHRANAASTVVYALMGIALSVLTLLTGALGAAVVAHTTYNVCWHASRRPVAEAPS